MAKTTPYITLLMIVALSKFREITAASADEYKNLQTSLMTGYSNKVRPVRNQTNAVFVYTAYFLADVNDVDVVQQLLITTAYLSVSWVDEFLQWDSGTGIERLHFKQVRHLYSFDVFIVFKYIEKQCEYILSVCSHEVFEHILHTHFEDGRFSVRILAATDQVVKTGS